MAKQNFYKIEFVNWQEDFEYTIVRTLNDVLPYLELAKEDLDTPPKPEDAPTSVTVTGIKMSEWQYRKFIKEYS